jgi:Rieske Fe-S protein
MTSAPLNPASHPARRTVMAAAGAAGLAVALTACGSDDESSAAKGAGSTGSGSDTTGESTEIAKTSDIPQGGGKVLADAKVVVTQPEAGTFKAFSYVCTHQGCKVNNVTDGLIKCPCHGSCFSIADGSVKRGPAPKPLPAVGISVDGDSIKLA